MKLETLQKPIKTDSIEQHEKELLDKMIGFELEYVERIFLKKIPPLSEYSETDDFSKLVENCTEIPSRIGRCVHRESNTGDADFLRLKEKIMSEICDLYQSDHEHWIERTNGLLEKELKEYEDAERKKEKESRYNKENKAGLIDFNMETDLGHLLPGSGISDSDICLQIHFEDFYKQQNGDTKNLFSSKSLEKLALKIVDEHPETKAIVAQSWLVDTAVAKRIGFTVYDRDFDISAVGGSFWGQFIDSNGQIKSNEILKFIKTGEPPYRTVAGAIMVEDFLSKYLPEDRRGKIILKEQTEESRKFTEDVNRISQGIKKWDDLSFDEIVTLLNSSSLLADFFKTFPGQGFVKMLKKGKELNLKRDDLRYFNYPDRDKFNDAFNQFIKENRSKFKEKEVII